MFKNNRTNFEALLENLKEKARLTKSEKSIKLSDTQILSEPENKNPEGKVDTSGKRKRKKSK
jgi:hypothetical protein